MVEARNLLDLAVGADDGPVLVTSSGPLALTTATTLTGNQLSAMAWIDNDSNPHPPTLAVGLTNDPTISATFAGYGSCVCWPWASGIPFDYTVTAPTDITSTTGQCSPASGGDSALLEYSTPHTLAPNQSMTFHYAMKVDQLGPIPTSVTAFADSAGGILSRHPPFLAALDSAAGVPVVGRTLAFYTGRGQFLCTAVTGTTGVAGCGSGSQDLSVILAGGYSARFAGDSTYAASAGSAKV